MKDVCLIVGAGSGIGGHVGERFAREGYHVALARRSDQAGLDKLVAEIEAEGGSATGCLINAVDEGVIESLIEQVESEQGPIKVCVFNLGAQFGNLGLAETSLERFELGWRLTSLALFRVAKCLLPKMVERGGGTLLVTSATAAMRGNKGQLAHASAIGGRRLLCQSLNAEFASQGIHVAHVVVDGAVDSPDTLGRLIGKERLAEYKNSLGEGEYRLLEPEHIAETYYHLSQQHPSAWTFEIDLRTHHDLPWWNSP